ncbi:hypothetical protein CDIK_1657 [Cucumispora dikerogammari]|nr:hypothetical protein CDIK_1657 [Cucumispora dikerogammari]
MLELKEILLFSFKRRIEIFKESLVFFVSTFLASRFRFQFFEAKIQIDLISNTLSTNNSQSFNDLKFSNSSNISNKKLINENILEILDNDFTKKAEKMKITNGIKRKHERYISSRVVSKSPVFSIDNDTK